MFTEKNRRLAQEKIQEEGSNLAVKNKLFLCQLPTGSGKGRLCMKAIDKIESDRKWLVVVPEIIQIENLREDIKKHGFEHLYDSKIEDVVCYASLEKFSGSRVNLWLNECHRLSTLREGIVKTIDFERIIADSATVPDDVRFRLDSVGSFFEYSMTFQEAVREGLIPEPATYVVYTEADRVKKRNPITINKKNFLLTDAQYIEELDRQIAHFKSIGGSFPEMWISNKIKKLGGDRKKFIAETKTETARKIIESLGKKKVLCYAGSVEQSDSLGGEASINSKRGKKHNLSVLRRFNSGEIDRIYMNKMGREGLNLEGINAVIMVQLSSGRDEGLEWIQKAGRGLRSTSPELYMIVCKGTIDETYFSRTLEFLDKNKEIKYLNGI